MTFLWVINEDVDIATYLVHMYSQDMLITAGFGLLCLCLATPTAILSNKWMNMESPPEGSGNIGNIYSDIRAIADSLGAASVRF